jgi:uncharacterized protein YcaQ
LSALRLPRQQVNCFVLGKQHLTPETRGSDVLQVVHDIVALHSTAPLSPYLSLWSRIEAFRADELDRKLYDTRRLVRLTCMRSTLHVVPAVEMPLFFQATQRQQRRSTTQMNYLLVQSGACEEGQEEATLRRLQELIAAVVAERGPSTVAELTECIPDLTARIEYAPDKPYGGTFSLGSQLVPWMCMLGLLVRAQPRGTWRSNLYAYAPLADWLPNVDLASIEPQEAQVQLLRQYLAAFGPATLEDMAWWSGLTKGETRRALSALGKELAEVTIEGLGDGYLMLAAETAHLAQAATTPERVIHLLPSLDPYIMGYTDRRRFLDEARYGQVFDRAGNAFNTVWVDGDVMGVWQELEAGVDVLVWDEAPREAVATEAARLGAFLHGSQVPVEVKAYPEDVYVRNPFALGRRKT